MMGSTASAVTGWNGWIWPVPTYDAHSAAQSVLDVAGLHVHQSAGARDQQAEHGEQAVPAAPVSGNWVMSLTFFTVMAPSL